MNQAERQKCRDAFERYDTMQQGVVDIWRIRDLMKAVDIFPTDEDLFQILPEAENNKTQTISFNDFINIVQNYKSTGQNTDLDPDLICAWQNAGGGSDKQGKVSIRKLQEVADQFGFKIRIEKVLERQILKKLAQKISSQNKKITLPEEIDFDDFSNLFGAESTEPLLPSWVVME